MPNQIAISEVAAGFDFFLTETFEQVRGAYLDYRPTRSSRR